MKWYKKAGFAFGSFVFSLVPTVCVVERRIEESIPPYVENNLPKIVKNQEEKLGIKHFGIPKIVYEIPPEVKGPLVPPGSYDPKKDVIYLPFGNSITPEENVTNTLATCLSLGALANIEEVINHELGHFYSDKLYESMGFGLGNWPSYSPDGQLTDDEIGTKLISEGIAGYFEKTINNKEDKFRDSDWPKKREDFRDIHIIYEGGFHLVKPIIGKHGKRGIEYLILNPPRVEDLENLPAYQSRILSFIEKKLHLRDN